MSDSTRTVSGRATQPGAARRGSAPGGVRRVVVAMAWALVGGVLVGVLWFVLAPQGQVIPQPGYLLAVDDPELAAGQDATFALLTAAAGVLTGALVAARLVRRPNGEGVVSRAGTALVVSGLASVLAWRVGALLGPPSVPEAVEAGGSTPVDAPLTLSAYGLLAMWPAVTATVLFVVLLATTLSGRPRRRG